MRNWPGHEPGHLADLLNACNANCTCGEMLTPGTRCGAHQLYDSERLYDRLAFVREQLAYFVRGESSGSNAAMCISDLIRAPAA